MKVGCVAKVMVITGSMSSYNDKNYYRLAVIGTDGSADNLDCTEEVYNRVMSNDFQKPFNYELDMEYSSGTTSKGRYQFLRVVNIGKKVG